MLAELDAVSVEFVIATPNTIARRLAPNPAGDALVLILENRHLGGDLLRLGDQVTVEALVQLLVFERGLWIGGHHLVEALYAVEVAVCLYLMGVLNALTASETLLNNSFDGCLVGKSGTGCYMAFFLTTMIFFAAPQLPSSALLLLFLIRLPRGLGLQRRRHKVLPARLMNRLFGRRAAFQDLGHLDSDFGLDSILILDHYVIFHLVDALNDG